MISLYRPGNSLLHRMPAWLSLLVLAAFALAVSMFGHSWPVLGAAAVLLLAGYLATGFGIGELWRQLRVARWLVLIIAIPQVVFLGPETALINTARVVFVVLAAALVTLTTQMNDLLDVVERMVQPLARFGIDPAKVGLVLALTITTVPVIAGLAGQIREAMRARGGPRVSVRIVLPLLVMTLQHGDQLADALRARGID